MGTTPSTTPAGAADYQALMQAQAQESRELCMAGYHAWTPWLELSNGSFVTVCGRQECHASQHYHPE